MTVVKYLVVYKISESRTRKAILEASVKLNYYNNALESVLLDAELVRDQIRQISGDSHSVKIVSITNRETILDEDLQRARRDAVAFPIRPDGRMSFDDAYFLHQ